MFDAGKLRSIESLNAAGRSLRVATRNDHPAAFNGQSWLVNRCPGFLTVRWVNRGRVDLVASPNSESYVGQMLQC